MNKNMIFSILVFFMIINSSSVILFSLSFKEIVDCLNNQNFTGYYNGILIMGITILIQLLSHNISCRIKNKYIKIKMIDLKENLYGKIFSFPISFFRKSDTSQYISYIFNDLRRYEENYIMGKIEVIEHVILLVFGTIGIISVYPKFLIVVIGTLLLACIIPGIFIKSIQKYSKKLSEVYEKSTTKMYELFEGFNVIKFSKLDKDVINESVLYATELENSKYKMQNYMIIVQCFLLFFTNILILLVFVIGGKLIIKNVLTVGTLITLIQLLFNITNPVISIISTINKIKSVENIHNRCNEILKWSNTNIKNLKYKKSFDKYIEIKNVSFKYHKDKDFSIKNFSFIFEKGKKYAIIGENGSGKSTILKLISNSLDFHEGLIEYDGINMENIDDDFFYNNISYINQDLFLFNKTIKENIILGKEHDNEAYMNLIDKLGILEFSTKNNLGMDTKINDIDNVSGGEKQRIVIARELLKNRSIILADEPNSALDIQSNNILLDSIEDEEKTLIMITHKIDNSLDKFDKLLVINKGELVESGHYIDLVQSKGYFYDLINNNDINVELNL